MTTRYGPIYFNQIFFSSPILENKSPTLVTKIGTITRQSCRLMLSGIDRILSPQMLRCFPLINTWSWLQASLQYNEYIVYNPAQIRMRYLLQVHFNYNHKY